MNRSGHATAIPAAQDASALLQPITDQLRCLAAERGDTLGVTPELIADDSPGWIPATELVRAPYDALRDLVAETAGRWDAPSHVAAALLWKAYGYWHSLPTVLGWVLERRVPLMPLHDTLVKASPAGVTVAARSVTVAVAADDPAAGAPGTTVVADAAAAVRQALTDGQHPIITALSTVTRVGERPLWGSTAEAIAHTLLTLTGPVEAQRRLAQLGEPVADLLTWHGGEVRRRTCCLWLALPGTDPCPTCCVRRCAGARS